MLVYKPGRKFQGFLMPKGKGSDKRAPKPYLREQRKPVQVAPGQVEMQPVSRQKIEKFLKEQCEELQDFISETDESRFLGQVYEEKKEEESGEEIVEENEDEEDEDEDSESDHEEEEDEDVDMANNFDQEDHNNQN